MSSMSGTTARAVWLAAGRGTALAAVFLLAPQPLNGQTGRPPAGPAGDQEYALYLASVAAADASLRLHETAAADRWLRRAPERFRGWEWGYLEALADESARVIPAHQTIVNGLGLSPDGRLVASAAADQSVKLWNASTGAPGTNTDRTHRRCVERRFFA